MHKRGNTMETKQILKYSKKKLIFKKITRYLIIIEKESRLQKRIVDKTDELY